METTWRQYRDNLGKTLGQRGDDLNKIRNIREKKLGTTLGPKGTTLRLFVEGTSGLKAAHVYRHIWQRETAKSLKF